MTLFTDMLDPDFRRLMNDHAASRTVATGGLLDPDFRRLMNAYGVERDYVTVWEEDADNHVRFYPAAGALWFTLGGAVVMTLDATGAFALASGTVEWPYSSETAIGDELALNALTSGLSFGVKRASDSAFVRVAELSTTGELRCAIFEERGDYPLTAAASPDFSEYIEWFDATTSTDFTGDGERTACRLLRTDVGSITNATFRFNQYLGGVL